MPEPLTDLPKIQTVTATEQVFDALYSALVTLGLEPGVKISEAEIAKQLGVSRQPVRDAFFRLSKLGLLQIRPQRATRVTKISDRHVVQSTFIRSALETACVRESAVKITDAGLRELRSILARQEQAVATGPRSVFHNLDDELHQRICEVSGHGYAWALIKEQKAHVDRVRYLSLSLGQQIVFEQHSAIVDALEARDADLAEDRLHRHLCRMEQILPTVREANPQYFEDATP